MTATPSYLSPQSTWPFGAPLWLRWLVLLFLIGMSLVFFPDSSLHPSTVILILFAWQQNPPTANFRRLRKLLNLDDSSVHQVPGANADELRVALQAAFYTTVDLDLGDVRDERSLAAALDAHLGPFQHPEDPAAKILAHLGHERRGAGHVAVLARGTATLRRDHPELLQGFVAQWAHKMRGNCGQRLLFLGE